MTIADARKVHALLVDEKWIEASNLVMSMLGQLPSIKNKTAGLSVLRNLLQFLLDQEDYLAAATLLWGGEMFSAEPESVQRIFESLRTNSKVLFCGASSMGKSYSAGAWMYLDWRRDPLYTSVKCVGVSEDQVRKHVFAHLVKLHRAATIPMAESVDIRDSDMWMGVKEAGFEFGITAIAYKQSQETSGGIKGYKSMPVRSKPHPKFGYYSRLRLLGDEGQNWPNGPFKDINTWVSQIDGPEKVKIAIAFNPESTSQLVVQMSEHEDGWNPEFLDTLFDWTAKSGWRVCRLDAARSENVIKRMTIYPGLQTYEGFMGYLKSGGDNSANYATFARGFPPTLGDVRTLIPSTWPQEARGEATFVETPQTCASVDLAFMGKDSAQMVIGRWGLASGYRNEKGEFTVFMDRLNITRQAPRHVLQVDQIIPLAKHDDTVKMSEEIMSRAKIMRIDPEWMAIDKMQPNSEPVLTPTGWCPMGSIKTGDLVIGSDGKPVKVTGVYPQKDRRVVKVIFNDGSWTRCGPEHLWKVTKLDRKNSKVLTTQEIYDDMLRGGKKWSVQIMSAPAEFCNPDNLDIPPYLLGCLLGDGNMTDHGIRFSSIDNEILDSISSLIPKECCMEHTDRCNYIIKSRSGLNRRQDGTFFGSNPLLERLKSFGLYGVKSHEKFIPFGYLRESYIDRLELLRGIMDTDGFVQGSGVGIRLSSERMILDIKELVESLGGSARYTTHRTFCGEKECRPAHKLSIAMPDGMIPFRLARKANALKTRRSPMTYRIIHRIEVCPDEDSTCIRVDAADHLYVTRNYIVTHNTGIGFGTWSHLIKVWGPVYGISWNEKATDNKIIAEDQEPASKQCDGVMSEMWWAFRKWIEPVCRAVLINPIIPSQLIHTQLTSRRYDMTKNGIKVEPKEKYRARNKTSPDEADALVMLVHVVRKNSDVIPGLHEDQVPKKGESEIKFTSVKNMVDTDADDSISIEGSDNEYLDAKA